jgi:protoporphyrinogen oxidase
MTVARRLAVAGGDVTLIECAPSVGGLVTPHTVAGVTWDRFYHVVLLSDGRTRALLRDLSLEGETEWVTTRTGVYARGRLYSVSSSLDLLMLPVLSPLDKARLAATVLAASRMDDGTPLEAVGVEDWLVRWSGRPAFDRFWLPLLRSKLGEAWRDASAAFIWATIRRLYAARRTGLKREMFGYVRGGYGRVLERYAGLLASIGVRVETGRRVARVGADRGRVEVAVAGAPSRRFDRVVVTTPMPVAAAVCEGLADRERERMAAVRYLGVVCPAVVLSRPLAGFYVTNLLDPSLPFTGIIEMTSLVDPRHLGGRHLVYLPRYVASDDPLLDAPDGEVADTFLDGLRRVHPDVARSQVLGVRVARARHVMAMPVRGYSARLPPVRTSIPGVYVLNSARISGGTLNVDETIGAAEAGLEGILADAWARGGRH